MALPYDLLLRQQRFTHNHPAWSIHAQEGPRFTDKDDGATRHIVAQPLPQSPARPARTDRGRPMTPAPDLAAPPYANPVQGMPLAHICTQRLAACGFGVRSSRWRDRHELIILNVPGGRSSLTLTADGSARWHYEPRASPPSAATLAAIIVHILGAPHTGG